MPGVLNSNDPFTRRAEEFAEYYSRFSPDEMARRARFHLAVSILLADYELSDDEISDQVLTDGSDHGIDFFFVSEDEVPRVWVVQVKDWERAPRNQQVAAVNKMVNEIKILLDRQRAAPDWDDRRRSRLQELKNVRDEDYVIEYVLALTGQAGPVAEKTDFPEGEFGDTKRLQILGREQLLDFETALVRAMETRVSLSTMQGELFALKSPVPATVFLVSAFEYARATRQLSPGLFELNPRLFLSKNALPNKSMLQTLNSEEDRGFFHLLNNGITALCRNVTITDGLPIDGRQTHTVNIQGLQVVNGCQTTETVWSWAADDPENARDVKLMVRLVKYIDDEFSALISKTTNTQSAILGTDLVANSEEQKKIKRALEGLPERPIFYENRRGALRKLIPSEKERYAVAVNEWGDPNSRQFRVIKMRELAQALQAVTGLPEQAKEGIAGIFKPGNQRYNFIFKQSWSDPEQLALVADLYKFISNIANWTKLEWRNLNSRLPEDLRNRYLTLSKLGRFYVLFLTYEYLRSPESPFSETPDDADPTRRPLLTPERSIEVRKTLVQDVSPILRIAVDSLRAVRENREHPVDGDRALLRQGSHKTRIQDRFRDSILQQNLN
jgi:hypothetical protein